MREIIIYVDDKGYEFEFVVVCFFFYFFDKVNVILLEVFNWLYIIGIYLFF